VLCWVNTGRASLRKERKRRGGVREENKAGRRSVPASWCWCASIKCRGLHAGHKPGLTAYCINETVPREMPYTKHPVPSQNEECGIRTAADIKS